ncbi:MAG: hypothetical protein J6A79_16550 [Clostridia bacterium]|nr:hypothetical protein [Clostridia bacterium]
MNRKQFRKTVVELAYKAAECQREADTDYCYSCGYARYYIGNPGRLASKVITARSPDGRQSDVYVNNRYLTTIFIK